MPAMYGVVLPISVHTYMYDILFLIYIYMHTEVPPYMHSIDDPNVFQTQVCDGNGITVPCMDCLGMLKQNGVEIHSEREPKSMMMSCQWLVGGFC